MQGSLEINSDLKSALVDNNLQRLPKKNLRRGRVYGNKGKTLLHLAAKYSTTSTIILYCANTLKIKPQTPSKTFKTLPIHVSCKYGKVEFTQILLSLYCACLEYKDINGDTPLGIACRYNHTDLAFFLLEYGASAFCINKDHYSPLHYASSYGNSKLVHKLLQSEAKTSLLTKSDESPLHLAVSSGNVHTVSLLLPHTSHMTHSKTGTIFHHCRQDNTMVKHLVQFSDWNKFPKLPILLDIGAPASLIFESCRNEFFGQYLYYIQVFDRADVLYILYSSRITSVKELSTYKFGTLNPKSKALISYLKQWRQRATVLFTYSFSIYHCIKRLNKSLIIELIKFL
ncbi:hypothetical protein SteCoe_32374 [Stentor coeruleus]|uniref:Uncharacterized protein n=1 Tax=Stentor coeruleus TaxID=5963 RepID=A0A1R2AZ80_9CILI|nr:hypothetical protein SteCoe_32374 [Stentor coeruleus]